MPASALGGSSGPFMSISVARSAFRLCAANYSEVIDVDSSHQFGEVCVLTEVEWCQHLRLT
jgi:hypothetical protein